MVMASRRYTAAVTKNQMKTLLLLFGIQLSPADTGAAVAAHFSSTLLTRGSPSVLETI